MFKNVFFRAYLHIDSLLIALPLVVKEMWENHFCGVNVMFLE